MFVTVHMITGGLATFTRLSPFFARYEYGFMIFVLTFSVISISGYREEDLLQYALARLETVLLGCGIAILTSLLIYPVWAGDDLHKLIIRNLEGFAMSLEGEAFLCSILSIKF